MTCLALAYFTIDHEKRETGTGKALVWIGGFAILPFTGLLAASGYDAALTWRGREAIPYGTAATGWTVALLAPLAFGYLMRGRKLLLNGVATIWVVLLGAIAQRGAIEHSVLVYLWLAIGAAGLIAWGMSERAKERVNVGVAAFALTVLGFYFSNVMDQLGRSASLI